MKTEKLVGTSGIFRLASDMEKSLIKLGGVAHTMQLLAQADDVEETVSDALLLLAGVIQQHVSEIEGSRTTIFHSTHPSTDPMAKAA